MKKSIFTFLFFISLTSPISPSDPFTPRNLVAMCASVIQRGSDSAFVNIVTGITTATLTVSWNLIASQLKRSKKVSAAPMVTVTTKEELDNQHKNQGAVHPGLTTAAQRYAAGRWPEAFITYVYGPGGLGKTTSTQHLDIDADVTTIKIQQSEELFKEGTDYSPIIRPIQLASRKQAATGRRQIIIIDDASITQDRRFVTLVDKIKKVGANCWIQFTTNFELSAPAGQEDAWRRRFNGGIIEVAEITAAQRQAFLEQEQMRLEKKYVKETTVQQAHRRRIFWENAVPVVKWVNPWAWWSYYHITETPESVNFSIDPEQMSNLVEASEGLNFTELEESTEAIRTMTTRKPLDLYTTTIARAAKEGKPIKEHRKADVQTRRLQNSYIQTIYQKRLLARQKQLQEDLKAEQQRLDEARFHRREEEFVAPMFAAHEAWKQDQTKKYEAAIQKAEEAEKSKDAHGRYRTKFARKLQLSYFGKDTKPFEPYLYRPSSDGESLTCVAEEEIDPLAHIGGMNHYQQRQVHIAAAKIQKTWKASTPEARQGYKDRHDALRKNNMSAVKAFIDHHTTDAAKWGKVVTRYRSGLKE